MRLLLLTALGTALVSLLSPAQATAPQPSQSTDAATTCPEGYKGRPDDFGSVWCMDSAGRNYTPENARAVAAYESAKAKAPREAKEEHRSFWHSLAFWKH